MLAISHSAFRARHCLALLTMATIWLVGCGSDGPQFHSVKGKVVFKSDESNAQFGSIEFRSETEPTVIARGKIQKDGTYKLSSSGKNGTVAGSHTVVILQVVGNMRDGRVIHHHGLEVAKKYIDHRTTDLRVDVKPSNNDLTLLVDKKK